MAATSDIPALVRSLNSGSRVAQLQAVNQLGELAAGSAAQCAAIAAAGAVPPLVQLIGGSSNTAVQTPAAQLLQLVVEKGRLSRDAIMAAGGMAPLVALLEQGRPLARGTAACALSWLARQDEQCSSDIVAAGAVGPLVQLLQCNNTVAQAQAASALQHIAACSEQLSRAIWEAGAVPLLVRLIPTLEDKAVFALGAMAIDRDEVREAIAAAGAVALLEQLLLSESCSAAATEGALLVLERLTETKGSAARTAVASVTGTLVKCLTTQQVGSTLELALLALGRLAANSPENSSAMLAAGLLPSLPQCLRSSPPSDGYAAWLLGNVADSLPAERPAIGTQSIVSSLVALIGCSDKAAVGCATWALHSLALDCPPDQRAALLAGAFDPLLRLLQGSTDDESGSSSERAARKGAAAVTLCTLARGSVRQMQAVRAAGAAAAIKEVLPTWQEEADTACVVPIAHAALELLETCTSDSSR